MKCKENVVATIVQVVAIIWGIIGIIYGFYYVDKLVSNEIGFIIIITSVISAVFIYAIGEIIQKLENIDNNTKKVTNVANDEIPKL